MKRAYSYAAIRKAEEEEIERGTSVRTLMERAGRALAEKVKAVMREKHFDEVLFVCGGGNNGGDGFTAAKFLFEEKIDVHVLCLAQTFSSACEEAKENFHGEILGRIPRRRYAFLVDCILGTGIARAPENEVATLIEFVNSNGGYVLSCDVPSGLGRGGIAFSPAVKADETLTLGALKEELLLSDGADHAGEISLAEIGISLTCGAELWEQEDILALFPKKRSHSNKGDYGSVAILSTCNILGAPLLAAGAALHSGAGYTDIYMTSSSVPCGDSATLAAFQITDELHRILCAAKYPACRFSFYDGEPIFTEAVAFGMGAGVGENTRTILSELFSSYERGALVLDADALNTLAATGLDVLKTKKCPVVITPHIKEFSRLTGKSTAEILSDPVGCARSFSKEYGVTVVLKNNRTVIAEGERTAIVTAGSPALSKGGSGDVLAGFLAGTCARGVAPFEAAVCACTVCGKAGELAAERMGEYAPEPTDIISLLPAAMTE